MAQRFLDPAASVRVLYRVFRTSTGMLQGRFYEQILFISKGGNPICYEIAHYFTMNGASTMCFPKLRLLSIVANPLASETILDLPKPHMQLLRVTGIVQYFTVVNFLCDQSELLIIEIKIL